MPELVYYPINDYDPAMKGMVVAAVAILHVFLAQFAIGGGALLCYFQWLAQTGREPLARRFTDGYFQVLVLASFVLGALTGVGIWFTVIQISPPTIGAMVKEFHWVWATEWTFFCLEVTAGYCFYRYKKVLNDRTRMTLLVIYTTAAWFSLFWINGILSWQLTPGEWIETRSMWAGFFNPGFWPTTLYRTVVCLTIASIVACILVNTMKDTTREEKQRLIHESAKLMFPMILMPLLGGWYLWTMPEDSRSWALGGSMTIMMFFNIAIGASALIGGYALIGLIRQRLYINGATATLLAVLAFGATAGGEFVREGVRKPYTVRKFMYSNSVRPEQVAKLREVGSTTNDPYPLKDPDRYPTKQLQLGAKVYRFQCSICHTIEGANALTDLAGSLTIDQARLNIAALQHTKPFMPPFCGTAEELEALVQLIAWSTAGSPPTWPETKDPKVIAQIQTWLDRAGVDRGTI
ncbi:MAG TPA: cytochrome c, partial [Pirellulales bacterium]